MIPNRIILLYVQKSERNTQEMLIGENNVCLTSYDI